jgi:type IV secretion system protein VirD4
MLRRILSVLVLLACGLAGSSIATQHLARTFGYAPALGAPVVSIAGTHVYSPFAWYTWQRQWGRHAKKDFAMAMGMAMAGLLLGAGVALRIRGNQRVHKPTGAFGTARWATLEELKRARLLSDRGIVLGQLDDAIFEQRDDASWVMKRRSQLLRYDGDGHTIVFLGTRGGKGVTIVVPTLLSYTAGSVLIHDPKGENWNLTAAWRRLFSHCLRVEVTAEHSVRFNPLFTVRPAPLDVRDAQNIAEMVVNPSNMTDEQRDHWKLTGHAFLVGVILHVLYAEKDKSLPGCLLALTDPERSLEDLLHAMMTTRHLPTGPHPTVAGAARAMLDREGPERASVKSTATSFLEIYRDPIIAANTSASDFTIADLVCGEAPVSLYFIVPQSDEERIRPVVRLMLNVIGRRLTENLTHVDCGPSFEQPRPDSPPPDNARPLVRWVRQVAQRVAKPVVARATAARLARTLRPYLGASQRVEVMFNPDGRVAVDRAELQHGRLQPKRHELLCLIDEFPMLGRIPFFANGISSMAGYGIRCLLITQSLKQLDDVYGKANSIIDNCINRVTGGTNCEQTAERISRLLGTQSLVRPQISVSKRPGLFGGEQVSESYQEYGRPLRTVDELLSMPFPELIVMTGNCRPYLGRKFLYYQDPAFSSRAGTVRGDGPNRPPTSPREQRAELPPQKAPPHWLTMAPAPRPAAPQKPPAPSAAAAEHASTSPAPVVATAGASEEPEEDITQLKYFSDFIPRDDSDSEPASCFYEGSS